MAEDPAGAADHVLVVILPDGGRSYLSKLYNDEWMRVNGLMDRPGSVARVSELLAERHHGTLPDLVVARTTQRVGEAIAMLQDYNISQMPVSQAPEGDDLESIVGAISEKGLLDRAFRDSEAVERTVGEIMDGPLPIVQAASSLAEAFGQLAGGTPALLVVHDGRPIGIVTKLDLLEYLAHHPSGGQV